MTHVKKRIYFATSAILLALLSGCASKTVTPLVTKAKAECMQEGINAPSWICKPEVIDGYASLGIAQKNGADSAQTIRVALQNGRIEIVKQMQLQVREKLNNFANTSKESNKEKVDNLYISIINEIKSRDLHLEEKLQSWTTPSGIVYIHVIAPKSNFDAYLKRAVKLSYVNHKSTWLRFQSKQITNLEKEFGVIIPIEQITKGQGVEIAEQFKVEIVSNTMVGRNRKK